MTVLGQLFFYKDGRPFQEILRYALNDRTTPEITVFWGIVISTKRSAWRNPLRRSSTTSCKILNLTVIQRVEKPEESPGKDTAYTPRRDDIQRLALMIYSHKRLTIYTASRDYGGKSVPSFRPSETRGEIP